MGLVVELLAKDKGSHREMESEERLMQNIRMRTATKKIISLQDYYKIDGEI